MKILYMHGKFHIGRRVGKHYKRVNNLFIDFAEKKFRWYEYHQKMIPIMSWTEHSANTEFYRASDCHHMVDVMCNKVKGFGPMDIE